MARSSLCSLFITALVPGMLIAADALPPAAPTPPKQQVAQDPPHTHLLDRVIPAYGMDPAYRWKDRAAALHHEIEAFLADVDSRVMAGTLHRPAPPIEQAKDANGKVLPNSPKVVGQRPPLPEELQLIDLLGRTAAVDQDLRRPVLPANVLLPERAVIDTCFSDLSRAAELLRLGMMDDTYTNLESIHKAWLQNYLWLVAQAREKEINRLVALRISQSDAEAAVTKNPPVVPYPAMRLDGHYPNMPDVPAPAPSKPLAAPVAAAPAPVAAPAPMPVEAPPAPMDAASAAVEAPPAPMDAPAPVEAPMDAASPAVEAPPVPMDAPAPMDAAPAAVEAPPAPMDAPAPVDAPMDAAPAVIDTPAPTDAPPAPMP